HRLDDLGFEMRGGARHKDLALVVILVNHAGVRAGQLCGSSDNRAKYGLEIERGAYRLTNLPEGSQLAHRAREVVGKSLEFLEEPHVLDRDDGLVGEGLQEVDVLLGEGARRSPRNGDRPDWTPFPEHRYH